LVFSESEGGEGKIESKVVEEPGDVDEPRENMVRI